MKRDISIEDMKILKNLEYTEEEIESILSNNKAYKAKSFPEQYIAEVLRYNYNIVEANKKIEGTRMEMDIFINDTNTCIEYNGYYWHKERVEQDKVKQEILRSNNIRVITIVEYSVNKKENENVKIINDSYIEIYRVGRSKDMLNLMKALSILLNKNLIIPNDIYNKVKARVYETLGNQSLKIQYPSLAKEYSKNNKIPVHMRFISDTDTVEWICEVCDNRFYSSINHRVYDKSECPYCVGNLAIPGETDILTIMPEYAAEITSISDNELKHILPYSSKYADWKCSNCGHKWNAKIGSRTKYKSGCPRCKYIPYSFNSDWGTLLDMRGNYKAISNAIIFNKYYDNINYATLIEEVLDIVLSNHEEELYKVVDNEKLVTVKNNVPILSYNKNNYRKAKSIGLKDKIIFYESHCSTSQTVGTILKVLNALNIDSNNILIKLDTEKLKNLTSKYVTLSKNKEYWNVTFRIKINEKDDKTCMVFIGSRRNYEDAISLKLSAELYYFNEIRDKSDLKYNVNIPKFEDTEEYLKLLKVNKIRKQYI